MKTVVFGSTGLCGRQIVKELLQKNITVAAYQRRPETEFENISVVTGSLEDAAKISAAIQDADVIVSAVGNRDYADPTPVVTPFVKTVCSLLKPSQRFIVVAGSGITLSEFNILRRDLPGQPEFLANQRADHWDAYCYLAPLDVDYLVICPTMMVEGDADGNFVFDEKYFPKNAARQISAGNVARFIAEEIQKKRYRQTRIGLANAQ